MDPKSLFEKAKHTAFTLSEALPFIQRYDKKTIVIKFGGHAMVDEDLARRFAKDVVLLKHLGINPVVVHGGGPQIGKLLDRLAIQSRFEDGLRVTDEPTMEVVEMVLAGAINKTIVRAINAAGGRAVGLSGSDANLIQAKKAEKKSRDPDSHIERVVDLGFVASPPPWMPHYWRPLPLPMTTLFPSSLRSAWETMVRVITSMRIRRQGPWPAHWAPRASCF